MDLTFPDGGIIVGNFGCNCDGGMRGQECVNCHLTFFTEDCNLQDMYWRTYS